MAHPHLRRGGLRARALRRFLQSRKAAAGLALLAVIALCALLAPYLATHDPAAQTLADRLQQPSAQHWLGTDDLGRDLFSRLLFGGRIALRAGFLAVGVSLVLGGSMGFVAAYYGGWWDHVLMRLVDMLLAIPTLLLALAVVAALGPGLTNAVLAVGIGSAPAYARVVRAAVLTVREAGYMEAARALGARDGRVMWRHVLPNAAAPVVVQVTLGLGSAIVATAALSFVGLGAQPPTPDWGAMLAQSRAYLRTHHHLVTFPGLAILLTVLAFNMVGDGLRDALDPRLSRHGPESAPRRRVETEDSYTMRNEHRA